MRKALLPMLVSLALCGAVTTAMVLSSARAQTSPHRPVMVAAMTGPDAQLAANDAPPPPRDRRMPDGRDRAARLKEMCNDLYARQTARLAYLETSLELTAAERPLFERWKDVRLGVAHRQADTCAERANTAPGADGQQRQARRGPPNPVDRMTREEGFLKQRLADLDAERPAMQAFYNALSPQQRMDLVRAAMRERNPEGGMRQRRMFADSRGPHGPRGGMDRMGPGPMGQDPMGRPPGPPDAPPPER